MMTQVTNNTATTSKKCIVMILLACVFCFYRASDAESIRPSQVVFIIHGTFAGDASWIDVDGSTHTFASELTRGFDKDVIIESFHWSGHLSHDARVKAAKRLALRLDADQYSQSNVMIVAHSHGGNVALHAIGLTKRNVQTVVCLATPHALLKMKRDEDNILLPIYCTKEARNRIKKLVTISADNDAVATSRATLFGVKEQTALKFTSSWRDADNSLRLPSKQGLVSGFVQSTIRVQLWRTNLDCRTNLAIANENISVSSKLSGVRSHSAIHSTRMGYVVGELLGAGPSADSTVFFKATELSSQSDLGIKK